MFYQKNLNIAGRLPIRWLSNSIWVHLQEGATWWMIIFKMSALALKSGFGLSHLDMSLTLH